MTVRQFEARYRADPDPWRYESSAYERDKYRATLDACGPGPFARALELGASIGVFSALLAPRCRELVTIDAAPTAVLAARRRLARGEGASVRALIGVLPGAIPHTTFDLVVASEILYYLTPAALDGTLRRLHETMAPGARLVAVHWRPAGPERPFTAAEVHARLRAQPWLRHLADAHAAEYLLDVMERSR
ncbi:MAG: class I SAM-dependent DNA methyltransferase [Solirubrobacteraceae bacterium]